MSTPRDTLILIEKFAFITTRGIADRAHRLGYDVVIVAPENLPTVQLQGSLHTVVRTADWSTAALNTIVNGIEQKHRVVGIGSVLGFFTGEGLLAAQVALLCQSRGLPYIPVQALFRANNKYLMRQALQQHGVYTVRHHRVTDDDSLLQAAAHVGFPLILKPVVGVGSSFISRCENVAQMQEVFAHYRDKVRQGYYAHFFCSHEIDGQYFDPLSEMLAEEAIDGGELSVECLCTDTDIHTLLIHDKLDVTQEAFCAYENLLVTPPVRFDAQAQSQILTYTSQVLRALGLRNCFCHVELRYDNQGRPSVIEVNPRVGGMRVKDSLRTVLGLDYEQTFLALLTGAPIHLPAPPERQGLYGMLAIYPRNSGKLTAVHGVEAARQLEGMLDIQSHVPLGTWVGGDFEEVFVVDAWFRAASLEDIRVLDRRVKSLVEVHVHAG